MLLDASKNAKLWEERPLADLNPDRSIAKKAKRSEPVFFCPKGFHSLLAVRVLMKEILNWA